MTEDDDGLRRLDDRRYRDLADKVSGMAATVSEIRDKLIATDIAILAKRVDSLEDWRTRWSGLWLGIVGFGIILATIGAFFGVLAYFGWHR